MRYLITFLLIVITSVASAKGGEGGSASNRVSLDLTFETYFNNREYAELSGESASDFAARLMPTINWQLSTSESLNLGVDWVQPFGSVGSAGDDGVRSQPFYYDVKPLIYYNVISNRWSITAGMFPRSMMALDSYSEAFFSDAYLFYNNVVSGMLFSYSDGVGSLFELACDWTGQPSMVSRESFVIYSAGRKAWGGFGAGYNMAMTHYAGSTDPEIKNVVDNVLVTPYLDYGCVLNGWLLELRVGYLQSLQRDRSYGNDWQVPSMWEVGFSLGRWGFTLEERLYLGDDLQPLYDGQTTSNGTYLEYGSALYNGAQDFRITTGVYNRAALSYDRYFSQDRVRLRAQFVTHANGNGLATQQILELSVKLGQLLYGGK